jgi:predicted ATPase
MEGDREPISLDPKTVAILSNIFPSLEPILQRDMRSLPFTPVSDRLDALEAGVRMTEGLRTNGPLFLVVDDIQWADRDSLSAFDRFQSAFADVGLGIITISREPIDVQRIAANKHITLTPLGLDHCIEILSTAAQRWSVEVSRSMLAKLAEAADGNPFRLRELCDEFRPGGSVLACSSSAFG